MKNFTRLPNWLLGDDVTDLERIVYWVVASYAKQYGAAELSYTTIVKVARCSKRDVAPTLAKLTERGAISITAGRGPYPTKFLLTDYQPEASGTTSGTSNGAPSGTPEGTTNGAPSGTKTRASGTKAVPPAVPQAVPTQLSDLHKRDPQDFKTYKTDNKTRRIGTAPNGAARRNTTDTVAPPTAIDNTHNPYSQCPKCHHPLLDLGDGTRCHQPGCTAA